MTLVLTALWAGLFAAAMAVLFSTPRSALVAAFGCGFIARFCHDLLRVSGAGALLSTAAAAAVVFVVAVALVRRPGISPIVLLSGLIPLGAAGALFNAIVDFLRISSMKGEALSNASVAVVSDLSVVVTSTLAIAVGAWVGRAIAEPLLRKRARSHGFVSK